MSDNLELAPGIYRIESAKWVGQVVTVGRPNAIDGFQKGLVGGVQAWLIRYNETGLATFQGRSADAPDGKFIAVDWSDSTLFYDDTPSSFILRRIGDYVAVCMETPEGVLAWQLPSPENGTPIKLDSLDSDVKFKWRFELLN
ncbi:uncharacterized protein EDB91DRAFT_1082653 [Suillus paluster]|uniref:uncharacterized protein n=1 Tax=Suillus paluster TaxID=48578 RepID=UPI001B861DE8|nr:uncharacterized protein EDB91DRAFT_1082653 [Suillus paluster]KAG1738610.1 hypothetical protein EDB91DRAFT_1082653 [Suillus paluster]